MRTIWGVLGLSVVCCTAVLAQSQKSIKPLAAAQEAYSFMGLKPGQPKAEATAVIGAMNSTADRFDQFEPPTCKTDASGLSGRGLEVCFFNVKYAYLPAYARSHSFVLLLLDDKVASINYYFDQDKYDSMVQSILKKYGAPKSLRNVVVENQRGATFRGKVYSWSNTGSQMQAKEYSMTLEKSVVEVEDIKLMNEFEARARDNGPKI